MTAATMDDDVFREFRKFGFSEKTAAKMARAISDHEAGRTASREAFAANGDAAKSDESALWALAVGTSFRDVLQELGAFFRIGFVEIKKMITGRHWNGGAVYMFVMISLLAVMAPALVGLLIYAIIVA